MHAKPLAATTSCARSRTPAFLRRVASAFESVIIFTSAIKLVYTPITVFTMLQPIPKFAPDTYRVPLQKQSIVYSM